MSHPSAEHATIAGLRAQIAALELELDEMTAGLAQAWDQLVPFLQAEPQRPPDSLELRPLLDSLRAAVDAPFAAAYIAFGAQQAADMYSEPADLLDATAIRQAVALLVPGAAPQPVGGIVLRDGRTTTWLFMPIGAPEAVHGAIGVGIETGTREFENVDVLIVQRIAERAASQLIALSLENTRAREARYLHELEIAGLIQRSIQPLTLPPHLARLMAAHWQPATSVGGDTWGWVEQPSGHLALFMIDVAGKGLPASLAAIALHTAMRIVLLLELSPSMALEKLNAMFYEAYTTAGIMATASICRVHAGTGVLEMANAGHTPTLTRTAGVWREWRAATPPLGVLEHIAPPVHTVALEPGDPVIVYSDGLSEIPLADGGLWGAKGLCAAADSADGETADRIMRAVLATAAELRAGVPAHDDETFMCLIMPGRGAPVSAHAQPASG
jgi:serine phosphatase RsbU (regulator of sigma subunit)